MWILIISFCKDCEVLQVKHCLFVALLLHFVLYNKENTAIQKVLKHKNIQEGSVEIMKDVLKDLLKKNPDLSAVSDEQLEEVTGGETRSGSRDIYKLTVIFSEMVKAGGEYEKKATEMAGKLYNGEITISQCLKELEPVIKELDIII